MEADDPENVLQETLQALDEAHYKIRQLEGHAEEDNAVPPIATPAVVVKTEKTFECVTIDWFFI